MICPHCAFPNDPGISVCRKCERSMNEPAVDACEEIPAGPLPLPSARSELDRARRMETEGNLRDAFVTCQSILMDRSEGLPDSMLSEIYMAMSRISLAQGKPERARKYQDNASLIGTESAGSANDLPAAVAPSQTRQVARRIPKPRSVQGRLTWVASFWGRAIAFMLDVILVSGLMAAMVALAALVLGYDEEQVVEALTGGFTNLAVMSLLFLVLLLTYLAVFARVGGQTLGKMLLGLKKLLNKQAFRVRRLI